MKLSPGIFAQIQVDLVVFVFLFVTVVAYYDREKAEIGMYPSTVAIVRVRDETFISAGALLSDYYVMTTPPYLDKDTSGGLRVIAGEVNLRKASGATRQERFVIDAFVREHRSWKGEIPIEIYRVDKPFIETYAVKFAKLACRPMDMQVNKVNIGAWVFPDRIMLSGVWDVDDPQKCVGEIPKEYIPTHLCLYNRTDAHIKFYGYDLGSPIYEHGSFIAMVTPFKPYTSASTVYRSAVVFDKFKLFIEDVMQWSPQCGNFQEN